DTDSEACCGSLQAFLGRRRQRAGLDVSAAEIAQPGRTGKKSFAGGAEIRFCLRIIRPVSLAPPECMPLSPMLIELSRLTLEQISRPQQPVRDRLGTGSGHVGRPVQIQ